MRGVSTPWRSLGLGASELRLAHCLPTGQSFGWRRVGDEYHGCLGDAGIALRENPESLACEWRCEAGQAAAAEASLRDYFRCEVSFEALYGDWRAADARFAAVADAVTGARVLRQDPLECLISFICSSNNNIARITLMLDRLRSLAGHEAPIPGGRGMEAGAPRTFPTLDALQGVDEQTLRDLGFGYRAPYVTKSVAHVAAKGGDAWLRGLRAASREDAKAALLECSGVGPKVADCVALFALDQSDCVPVDTHVWRIARRDLDASLADCASITPAVYDRVGDLFRDKYAHAGWAHTVLFAAELPLFADKLPKAVIGEMAAFRALEKAASKDARDAKKARADAKRAAAGEAAETPPPKQKKKPKPKGGASTPAA